MEEKEATARGLKEGTLLLWKQQMWGGSASCSWGEAHTQKICTCAAVPGERHPEITHASLSLPDTHSHNRSPESEVAAC